MKTYVPGNVVFVAKLSTIKNYYSAMYKQFMRMKDHLHVATARSDSILSMT